MGGESHERDKALIALVDEIRPFYLQARTGRCSRGHWYKNCVQSAFAKAYELVALSARSDSDTAFFYTPCLRGICEDLIVLSFMADTDRKWRNEAIENLMLLEVCENLETQARFFGAIRSFQHILMPANNHDAFKQQRVAALQRLWSQLPNGWSLTKNNVMPQVRQIAERTDLVVLYDFIYRITCDMVHFNPQVLLRAGWGDPVHRKNGKAIKSATFTYSNFSRYYQMYGTVYGVFLLVLYFELLGRFLEPNGAAKSAMRGLRNWLFDLSRWPEVVTHEEMNLEPPGPLAALVARLVSKAKKPRTLMSALRAVSHNPSPASPALAATPSATP